MPLCRSRVCRVAPPRVGRVMLGGSVVSLSSTSPLYSFCRALDSYPNKVHATLADCCQGVGGSSGLSAISVFPKQKAHKRTREDTRMAGQNTPLREQMSLSMLANAWRLCRLCQAFASGRTCGALFVCAMHSRPSEQQVAMQGVVSLQQRFHVLRTRTRLASTHASQLNALLRRGRPHHTTHITCVPQAFWLEARRAHQGGWRPPRSWSR